MANYVIPGTLTDGVLTPSPNGTPIPIGRAREDGQDVRIAPDNLVIQGLQSIPADLAADIGAVPVIQEQVDGNVYEWDGYVPVEQATLVDGTYVRMAINKRQPDDGKVNATAQQVTDGSAAIIAQMVAEQQATVIADYRSRVVARLRETGRKLTPAQRTALENGALAALQAAKLAP